jgi:preprotein translocase subunit SecE
VANAALSGVLAVNSRRSIPLAEKDKKAKKTENAIQRYFRETSGELRKVNWPTWPEARRLTMLVLIVMVAMGIFLSGMDYLADQLMNLVLGL